jgi:hypothetical protein
MNAILISEQRKLATLRLPWGVLAFAVVFTAGIAGVAVHLMKPGDSLPVPEAALGITEMLWFLVMLVAVVATAGESQHRTIRTTLLATPQRTTVLVAKGLVLAGYGALVTLAGMTGAVVTSLVTAPTQGVPMPAGTPAQWAGVGGAVLVGALFAVLSGGLGMLTRSTAFALTALLLWRFVGEEVLPIVLRRPGISEWTPSGVAETLVGSDAAVGTILASGALLLGYTAFMMVAAGVTFQRRDPV